MSAVGALRVRPRELVVLAAVVALGGALRGWRLAAEGIDHYDEAVYLTSAEALGPGASPDGLFPAQPLFSPPLYFALVGLALRWLGGATDLTAIGVNVALGTLTIGVLWYVARRWHGPRAAAAAAALAAFSPFHILMSRTALTDVAFALLFLVALAFLEMAQERQSLGSAIAAGVAVGLAWNTKYHGWFALVVGGLALVPRLLRDGWRSPLAARRLRTWSVSAAVAVLCFVPWALYALRGRGQAGELALHYLGFLRLDWLGNLAWQADAQLYFEHPVGRLALPVAVLAAGMARGPASDVGWKLGSRVSWTAATGLLLGCAAGSALLTLAMLPRLVAERERYSARIELAWIGLWLAAAPLYQAYARLMLPLSLAGFVLAGAWIARADSRRRPPWDGGGRRWLAATAVVAMAAVLVGRFGPGDPWRASRDAARAAATIAAATPPNAALVVIGEPSVVHYLRAAGRDAVARASIAELASREPPAFVVSGVYARRAPALRAQLESYAGRLQRVLDVPFEPSDLRLLDDMRPPEARRYRARPDATFVLRLDELQPAGVVASNGEGAVSR